MSDKKKELISFLKAETLEIFNIERLLDPDNTLNWCFSTDTREDQKDGFFLALKGENFNGNLFYKEAFSKSAKAFILDEINESSKEFIVKECIPTILVKNSLRAYQKIANFHRKNLKNLKHVIGITGSSGKTSTKNLLEAVLSTKYKTIATNANENNEIGIPKTILRATDETEILIIEMGMRAKGQIAELTEIAEPDLAIITNLGNAHIGILGSRKNIAEAKFEIFSSIPDIPEFAQTVYLPNKQELHEFTDILNFIHSYKNKNFEFCEKPELIGLEKNKLNFIYKKNNYSLKTFNFILAKNASLVIDLCNKLGMNSGEIAEGLLRFLPGKGRGEILSVRDDLIILDETYNGNPDSVSALAESLDLLASKNNYKKLLILGELAELGEQALALLKLVAEKIKDSKIDLIILKNGQNQEEFAEILHSLRQNVILLETSNEISDWLKTQSFFPATAIVGIKGSRVAKLDEIINKFD